MVSFGAEMEHHEEESLDLYYYLPEGCIATILSLTTPVDACRSSCVSSTVRSAASSNTVWARFIPPDYQKILSSSVSPVKFSTNKELYFLLCDSILVDDSRKRFSLERSTGKVCYMLSARELSITWADDPMYWCWKPGTQSRFPEVVELRSTWWLEINGKIKTSILSRNTTYGAYLVIKISDRAYGLDSIPSEITVEVTGGGDHKLKSMCAGTASLSRKDSKKQKMERLFMLNRMEMVRSRVMDGDDRVPTERVDGWMEIELGEFHVDGGDECREVKMSLKEIKGGHLKGGLIVEGIEIRPKH